MSLSAEQAALVAHPPGPLLIVAGAGSGKTRVLAHRVAWLIAQGSPPAAILAATFTNQATEELRERLVALVGPAAFEVRLGTLHASAARILREHGAEGGLDPGFRVLDPPACHRLLGQILTAAKIGPEILSVASCYQRIGELKEAGVGPDAWLAAHGERWGAAALAQVYRSYEAALAARRGRDFADLAAGALRLLTRAPHVRERLGLEHLLIDEFQDTDPTQFQLLLALLPDSQSLTAVGDTDQAIFAWRGADPAIMLGFGKEYLPGAAVRCLSKNWRSSAPIVIAARTLIEHNQHRHPHAIVPGRTDGLPVRLVACRDEAEERAQLVAALGRGALGKSAVLYRTHHQRAALAQALREAGLPVAAGDGEGAAGRPAEAVQLATFHAAKGCEWERVFAVGCEEGLVPHARTAQTLSPTAIEEERRLFYVGITRAKSELTLFHCGERGRGGRQQRAWPSRFLAELPAACVVRR